MITFNLPKRLALYVAVFADSISLAAIAKALMGIEDMDTVVPITVKEEDIVNIFMKLTILPEGVSALYNNQLYNILYPLLPEHPELAIRIQAISQSNFSQREEFEIQGLQLIERIQESINNN